MTKKPPHTCNVTDIQAFLDKLYKNQPKPANEQIYTVHCDEVLEDIRNGKDET